MNKIRTYCIAVLIAASVSNVYANSSPLVLVLGLRTGPEIVALYESPVTTELSTDASMSLSWRRFFPNGGYFNISSELAAETSNFTAFYDREYIRLLGMLPIAGSRVKAEIGMLSSIFGADDDGPYVNPSWEVSWLPSSSGAKNEASFRYFGHTLTLTESDGDLVHEGLAVNLRVDPSIRFGGEIAAIVGWERWFEWFLFESDGTQSNTPRTDWIAGTRVQGDGMIGYFAEWLMSGYVAIRSSSANLYYETLDEMLEQAESRVLAVANAEINWSPHQNVVFDFGFESNTSWYLERKAIGIDGFLTEENLRRTDFGLSIGLDWTLNHTLFAVAGTDLGYTLSNSAAETGWYIQARAGLQLSF